MVAETVQPVDEEISRRCTERGWRSPTVVAFRAMSMSLKELPFVSWYRSLLLVASTVNPVSVPTREADSSSESPGSSIRKKLLQRDSS